MREREGRAGGREERKGGREGGKEREYSHELTISLNTYSV